MSRPPNNKKIEQEQQSEQKPDKIKQIQKQIQELRLFKLKLNIHLSELVYELALEKLNVSEEVNEKDTQLPIQKDNTELIIEQMTFEEDGEKW
jgi:hypothetical protein